MVLQGSASLIYPDAIACGTAPLEKKLIFLGKNDAYYFVAMNHGYQPDTHYVTRDSSTTIRFNLTPLAVEPIKYTSLQEIEKPVTFYLLPVNTEVILHKGVGSLDRYEKSEELTRKWGDSIDISLKRICSGNELKYISDKSAPSSWDATSINLKRNLLPVKGNLLPYYPEPACVGENNKLALAECMEHVSPSASEDKPLLIYVWCKSTEPTAGRVIGNAALVVASGAVSGYQSAVYGSSTLIYNPDAFTSDNSTIWMAYVIDPENGTILHVEQRVLPYNLTNEKNKDRFIGMLAGLRELLKQTGSDEVNVVHSKP